MKISSKLITLTTSQMFIYMFDIKRETVYHNKMQFVYIKHVIYLNINKIQVKVMTLNQHSLRFILFFERSKKYHANIKLQYWCACLFDG